MLLTRISKVFGHLLHPTVTDVPFILKTTHDSASAYATGSLHMDVGKTRVKRKLQLLNMQLLSKCRNALLYNQNTTYGIQYSLNYRPPC